MTEAFWALFFMAACIICGMIGYQNGYSRAQCEHIEYPTSFHDHAANEWKFVFLKESK